MMLLTMRIIRGQDQSSIKQATSWPTNARGEAQNIHCTAQYSTVQCNAVQFRAMQHIAEHNTMYIVLIVQYNDSNQIQYEIITYRI